MMCPASVMLCLLVRLVEGLVPSSSNCSVILEDESGLCGYVFALADAKSVMTKAQVIKTPT